MPKRHDGGPAFPDNWYEGDAHYTCPGMSLRDYFAGQALAGMLASPPIIDRSSAKVKHDKWAQNAYLFADAMLAEREQK